MDEKPKGRLWLKILGGLFMAAGLCQIFDPRPDVEPAAGTFTMLIGVLLYWRGTKPPKPKPIKCLSYTQNDLMFIKRAGEIIGESLQIIASSNNWETIKSRMELVIDKLEELVSKYHNHPDTEKFKNKLAACRENFEEMSEAHRAHLKALRDQEAFSRLEAIREQVKGCLLKAKNFKSVNTQVNECSKALVIIEAAQSDQLIPKDELEKLRQAVTLCRSQFELGGHINTAEKQEFKGNDAKALSAYQDALWHLLNDDVDDSLQDEAIQAIKAKIEKLQDSQIYAWVTPFLWPGGCPASSLFGQ